MIKELLQIRVSRIEQSFAFGLYWALMPVTLVLMLLLLLANLYKDHVYMPIAAAKDGFRLQRVLKLQKAGK